MSVEEDERWAKVWAGINEFAAKRQADILMYNGHIARPYAEKLIDLVQQRRRRENVVLVLCTLGGDANAAYRIARCLQTSYTKFAVAVAGYCKSAGTLVLLGAHSVILLERAELGPLDVQLRKSDELAEFSSGLTPTQAISFLGVRAMESFASTFLQLKSRLALTTRTAGELASALAVGLYEPIMAQLDPMRIGEMDRELNVAREYGERLIREGKNIKDGALARLVAGYPSHDFVIDRREAAEIFKVIERPAEGEETFWGFVDVLNRDPLDNPTGPHISFLSHEDPEDADFKAEASPDENTHGGASDERGDTPSAPPAAAEDVGAHPTASADNGRSS